MWKTMSFPHLGSSVGLLRKIRVGFVSDLSRIRVSFAQELQGFAWDSHRDLHRDCKDLHGIRIGSTHFA